MFEHEKEQVCKSAVLAALETIERKCGGHRPKLVFIDDNVAVFVPNPVPGDKKEGLSCRERIKAVAESDWAMGEAKGLAEKLFGLKPGTPGYEEAVKRAAMKIARGAIPECAGVEVPPEEITLH